MRRALVILLLLAACGGSSKPAAQSNSSATTTTAPATSSRSDVQTRAAAACHDEVKKKLKSPGSAAFEPDAPDNVTQTGTGADAIYEVAGSVDSQNGYGALLRSEYVCEVATSLKPPPEFLVLVPVLK